MIEPSSAGEWVIGRLAVELVILGGGVVLLAAGDDVKVVTTEKEDALVEVTYCDVVIAHVIYVCDVVVVIHTPCGIYGYCNVNVTVMIIIHVYNTTRGETHNAMRFFHVTCHTKNIEKIKIKGWVGMHVCLFPVSQTSTPQSSYDQHMNAKAQ